MLWLRGNPPNKKEPAPPGGYDYEIRELDVKKPSNFKKTDTRGLRAKEYYFLASSSPDYLLSRLTLAYRYLSLGKPSAGEKVSLAPKPTDPIEFHIKAQAPVTKPDLFEFTKGRMDLHPAVIMRAMPEGVFQLLPAQIDIDAGDALWLVATRYVKGGPFRPWNSSAAQVDTAKMMVRRKVDSVMGHLASGKLMANGQLSGKAVTGKDALRERRFKRPRPDRHAESPPNDSQPEWIREILRPVTFKAQPSDDWDQPSDDRDQQETKPQGGLRNRLPRGLPPERKLY
ncbi:hypothetical protein DHEL01_v210950 [Diaporthe helianthi]|uniref:Uncharacterized protein n=1 Tax=Diaporthe helianthi TaxID=158607 RepID=A0A2P5HK70_DIAHE|nr:hypothetical protein DHEL01_v210950 [Diaporthe helianthi]